MKGQNENAKNISHAFKTFKNIFKHFFWPTKHFSFSPMILSKNDFKINLTIHTLPKINTTTFLKTTLLTKINLSNQAERDFTKIVKLLRRKFRQIF